MSEFYQKSNNSDFYVFCACLAKLKCLMTTSVYCRDSAEASANQKGAIANAILTLAVGPFGEDKFLVAWNGRAIRHGRHKFSNIDDLIDLDALSTACSGEIQWLHHIHLSIHTIIYSNFYVARLYNAHAHADVSLRSSQTPRFIYKSPVFRI